MITADGVSPKSLVIKAGSFRFLPAWTNLDRAAHTVTFDSGRCLLTIAPDERKWCGSSFLVYAGTYRYRVSNLKDRAGEVVVVPNERRVTIVTSRTSVRAGQTVRLDGSVFAESVGPFGGVTPTPTVTVLRRLSGSQRFLPIGRVRSRDCARPYPTCDLHEAIWSTTIRPRSSATYVARIVDPLGKTIWQGAESRRVVVRVIP